MRKAARRRAAEDSSLITEPSTTRAPTETPPAKLATLLDR
jgi:hypothetical protein